MVKNEKCARERPRILIIVDWYIPAFKAGGPIRSIQGLVQHLKNDFNFSIITGAHDLGETNPLASVWVDGWQLVDGVEVFYASNASMRFHTFRKLLNDNVYDVLYLNSFFSPRFSIQPLFLWYLGLIKKCPIIVAPRGEFSPGALRIKTLKKKLYIWLSKMLNIYSKVVWQASTEYEAKDIEKIFPQKGIFRKSIVRISKDLSDNMLNVSADILVSHGIPSRSNNISIAAALPMVEESIWMQESKKAGNLRIVFLSRISAMKNLDYALDVVRNLKGDIIFDIYGPVDEQNEAAYWARCKSLMKEMPRNIEVRYKGTVNPNDVCKVFNQYDVFLFPSRGENFGHVIAESLSAGCPVIVSDQTPWRDLEAKHAGWDLPLACPSVFVEVLEKIMLMNAEEYTELSKSAKMLAQKVLNCPEAVQQNIDLFQFAYEKSR